MRYLLHGTQLHELGARREYLYDIFKLYFLPGKPEGRYIPLIPVGNCEENILFITGHTNCVHEYLQNYIDLIPEKEIVIISCMPQSFARYTQKRIIYVPNVHGQYCNLRNGRPFGFGFNISDAELNLYNTTGDVRTRIKNTFIRL